MFDVTSYGAVGDGTTDDRPAIQDAIDAASVSGGVVFLPQGTYLLDTSHPVETGLGLVINADNVFLEGEGRGVTKIKLGNNRNSSVVNFGLDTTGIVGGGISKLEIDGNRANQSGGHCLRAGGSLNGWVCKDVYLHHAFSYGIGLQYQVNDTATYKNLLIENVLTEDTGLDGIDIKNSNDNNVANRMSNVIVRRFGLRTDQVGQTGVDIRGHWRCNGIIAEEYNNTTARAQCGIRFRQGETDLDSGTGGHYSSLTNFSCRPSSTQDTIGVEVSSYQVQISAGYIEGAGMGVRVNQSEVTMSSVVAKVCIDGFVIYNSVSMPTSGDRFTGSALVARSCTGKGFLVSGDYTILSGLVANTCGTGVHVGSTANHTVLSGVSSGNTTNYANNGTNTHNLILAA